MFSLVLKLLKLFKIVYLVPAVMISIDGYWLCSTTLTFAKQNHCSLYLLAEQSLPQHSDCLLVLSLYLFNLAVPFGLAELHIIFKMHTHTSPLH